MAFTKEKITPKGALKYRLPNIHEGFEFLSAVTAIQITNMGDAFTVKGSFIPKMKNLVDWESMQYESYDHFLEDIENNFIPMKEIADEIFMAITSVLVKKRSSSMPSVPQGTVSQESDSSNSSTPKLPRKKSTR